MTVEEILKLSEEKQKAYLAPLSDVVIDGNTFSGYRSFTFFWAKTYVKSPSRSGNGTISNLDTYSTFVVPILEINFAVMSIDDYRRLMQLLYAKNEHTVTCYDIVYNKRTTNKMYFDTEQTPKLLTLAKSLNGNNDVMLYGVQDYTVKLMGTLNDVETVTVTYHYNIPPSIKWGDKPTEITAETPKYISLDVGADAIVEGQRLSNMTLRADMTLYYKLSSWSTTPDKTGTKYMDGGSYIFNQQTDLYAVWEAVYV